MFQWLRERLREGEGERRERQRHHNRSPARSAKPDFGGRPPSLAPGKRVGSYSGGTGMSGDVSLSTFVAAFLPLPFFFEGSADVEVEAEVSGSTVESVGRTGTGARGGGRACSIEVGMQENCAQSVLTLSPGGALWGTTARPLRRHADADVHLSLRLRCSSGHLLDSVNCSAEGQRHLRLMEAKERRARRVRKRGKRETDARTAR